MNKQDIENKIQLLILKWKVKPVPNSKEWWRYKCDRTLYLYYREQIKKIESGELTDEQMANILSS